MTGSEFIRKLTELTKAGKVKWEDDSAPFYREYSAMIEYESGLFVIAKIDEQGHLKINSGPQTIYSKPGSLDLFNAISDTMPDIQTLFDTAIKELEK